MTTERLQKYLARSGVASRRASEELIAQGRVSVNGTVVTALGTAVDPTADRVAVDGRPVSPPRARTYVLLYKPPGIVSTAHDPEGRPTVVDLVPSSARLYPIGRLDYDSEGLILLSDDGDLTVTLTHPRHEVEKEYYALVDHPLSDAALDRLRSGVLLDGRRTAPAIVERARPGVGGGGYWLRVVLREGRNRQVRRMIEAVGGHVLRLVRTRIGPLRLSDLEPGEWRDLTDDEVRHLREAGA
ncbi:MAG: rRNA pseudouridine synthase [Chloroflexota bacterium]|nr:rRNA pseudouridine synthase [Chloroflexota bacterium]